MADEITPQRRAEHPHPNFVVTVSSLFHLVQVTTRQLDSGQRGTPTSAWLSFTSTFRWIPEHNSRKEDLQFSIFRHGCCLTLNRLHQSAEWDDVTKIVYCEQHEGRLALVVCGMLTRPNSNLISRETELIVIFEECNRNLVHEWVNLVRVFITPWRLLTQMMTQLKRTPPQGLDLDSIRKELANLSSAATTPSTSDKPALELFYGLEKMVTVADDAQLQVDFVKNVVDFVRTVSTIVIRAAASTANGTRHAADLTKSIAVVSSVFQVVAFGVKIAVMVNEAQTGPFSMLSYRVVRLQYEVSKSMEVFFRTSTEVDIVLIGNIFRVQEETLNWMAEFENCFMRDNLSRRTEENLRHIIALVKRLEQSVVILSNTGKALELKNKNVPNVYQMPSPPHPPPSPPSYFIGMKKKRNSEDKGHKDIATTLTESLAQESVAKHRKRKDFGTAPSRQQPHAFTVIFNIQSLGVLHEAFSNSVSRIFHMISKRVLFDINSCIDELEQLTQMEYFHYCSRHENRFIQCLTDLNILRHATSLNISEYKVKLPRIIEAAGTSSDFNPYLIITKKSPSYDTFLILTRDFLLHYNGCIELFRAQVAGSPLIEFSYDYLKRSTSFFDSLIGTNMAIQQVHLLVRRLLQFTRIQWSYACLATFERNLPNAESLRSFRVEVFADVVIDLDPTNFECLSGFEKVGYLPTEDENIFSVGLKMFGNVVGFLRNLGGLAKPTLLTSCDLEDCPELTDIVNFPIGGDHIEPSSREIFHGSTLWETTQTTITQCTHSISSPLVFEHILSGDMAISHIGEGLTRDNIHNLAWIPRNKILKELLEKKYGKKDLKQMKYDFICLGYGETLSESLMRYTATQIPWGSRRVARSNRGEERKTCIAEAQNILLKGWGNLHRSTMEPLTMSFKKYLRPGHKFFVLNSGKLYVTKSLKTYSCSTTAGFMGYSASLARVDKALTSDSEVDNVLGAVEAIMNKKYDCDSLSGGTGRIPSLQGMREMLGALTLTCSLLSGRVQPSGRFKSCILMEPEDKNRIKQKVDFNIPVPCGVACCTVAKSNMARRCILVDRKMISDRRWQKNIDSVYPATMGVDPFDHEVHTVIGNMLAYPPSPPKL